jgi:predicted DCC family thiol-disulfide oxidoreductase YuxK
VAAPDPNPAPAASAVPAHVVLYDGVCGFCDATVRWLLAHDRRRVLRYAALQGKAAAELRARHAEIPAGLEGLVYVERRDGEERVYVGAPGVFRILAQLDPPWRWLAVLGRLPRAFTDAVYGFVVRHRYRIFGRLEACRVPDPAERDLFLD